MIEIEKFLLSPSQTIHDAIKCIDGNEYGIALVVDEERHLIGTIVDGDIRRAILAEVDLNGPITVLLARKSPDYRVPVVARVGTDKTELLILMKRRSVRQIPLLDEQDRVVEVVHIGDLASTQEIALPIEAVLMAGGFGKRLHPLTETVPKPMLPIGDQPLMELVVKQLRRAGIRHINVTTHYRAEQIRDHFGDGSALDVEINYVSEEKPLGTAGGVGLIDTPTTPLLVMNGDLLTDVNFQELFTFHQEQKAALTVGVRKYEMQIPYGVVESKDGFVTRLVEKPSMGFFINAGIYLLEPSAFAMIPKQQHINMTDLIDVLIANNMPVACFPIREYWLDIGQHTDYQKAQDDLREGKVRG